MVFGIDGAYTDVLERDDNHGQRHRYGGSDDVERAEQFVLFQKRPGLFDISFDHFSFKVKRG